MCGIGFVIGQFDSYFNNYISKLRKNLIHRGPDFSSEFTGELKDGFKFGLVHTRLSLLDLSANGHQPMIDEISNNKIIFNGEIYNHKEIKKELSSLGEKFKSSSDTEVLLKGYRCFGLKKLIEKIRGMYVFMIWDYKNKNAIIVRDKIGIKPLYYTSNSNFFACASECNALVKSNLVSRKISASGLDSYLAYGSVQSPLTIYEDVSALMPGHALIVNSRGKIINKIDLWSNQTTEEIQIPSNKIFFNRIEEYFSADVPIGIFLSGGYDSTLLAFLSNQISSKRINTFNVKFSEFPEYSEHNEALKISKNLNSVHHELDIKKKDVIRELPNFFNAMDQPSDDGLNIYLLSNFANKKGFKACFHGIGGDELFGGYPSFKQIPKFQKIKSMPLFIRRLIANYLGDDRISLSKIKHLLLSDLSTFESYLVKRQNFSFEQRAKLFNYKPPLGKYGISPLFEHFLKQKLLSSQSTFEDISYLELFQYCGNKLLPDCDVMSMSKGLEIRLPLLDPIFLNIKSGTYKKKSDFVKKFKGFPLDLMSSKKKGFTLPIYKWFLTDDDEINQTADILNSKFLFDKNYLMDILKFKKMKGKYSWLRSWQLMSLSKWAIAKL